MNCHSESLDLLAAAIVAAQADIEKADKDGKGNYGKYTTLRSVWDACKPALQAQGLAVLQFSEPSESGTIALTTMLLHKSGQYITGTEVLPLQKNDPQGYGSALTYARRYGLAAMTGVCPDDDDAAAAVQKPPAVPRTAPPARGAPKPATVAHKDATPKTASDVARKWFMATIKDQCGITPDEAKRLLEIKSYTDDFPDHSFEQILAFIKTAQLRQQKEAQNAAN